MEQDIQRPSEEEPPRFYIQCAPTQILISSAIRSKPAHRAFKDVIVLKPTRRQNY